MIIYIKIILEFRGGNCSKKENKIKILWFRETGNDKEYLLEKKINSYDGKYKTSERIKNYKKIIKFGIFDELYGYCKPIVNINYQREYFKIDKFRITFDKNIKYSIFKKKNFIKDLNKCIIEVKTNNLNLEHEINNLFPFKKIRYSKYANSINLLKLA